MSFHDGDVTQPYVEAPIWYRNAPPSGYAVGAIALQGKHGQKVVLKADGSEIEISAGKVVVRADAGDVSVEASGTILLGGSAALEALIKGARTYSCACFDAEEIAATAPSNSVFLAPLFPQFAAADTSRETIRLANSEANPVASSRTTREGT